MNVLMDAWELMVRRFPDATLERDAGVFSLFGHLPLPFLNISVIEHPTPRAADFRAALGVTKRRAAACRYGSLVAVCGEWMPGDGQDLIASEGYTLALNMTGMDSGQLLPARRPAPQMEYRRVADPATATDLAMVNAQAYGMQPDLFKCICNLLLWQPEETSFGFVGYADGRAVTTSATFPVRNCLYVALVATLPEAHGRGYAEAVMRHAIEYGMTKTGLTRAALHASDMGRPLYRSMGFEASGQVALLGPK